MTKRGVIDVVEDPEKEEGQKNTKQKLNITSDDEEEATCNKKVASDIVSHTFYVYSSQSELSQECESWQCAVCEEIGEREDNTMHPEHTNFDPDQCKALDDVMGSLTLRTKYSANLKPATYEAMKDDNTMLYDMFESYCIDNDDCGNDSDSQGQGSGSESDNKGAKKFTFSDGEFVENSCDERHIVYKGSNETEIDAHVYCLEHGIHGTLETFSGGGMPPDAEVVWQKETHLK